MTRPLIFLTPGILLLILTISGNATHPLVGYLVGAVLVLIGVCVLVRKWPKPESDTADVENQINLQR